MFDLSQRIPVVVIWHIHHLCILCHLLGWVSCLTNPGVSSACCATPHTSKQCLTTFGLCSIVPRSTTALITNIRILHHPPASGDPVVAILSSFMGCLLLYGVSQGMTTRQRHRHPARNSANLALRSRWLKPQGAILDRLPKLAAVTNLSIS